MSKRTIDIVEGARIVTGRRGYVELPGSLHGEDLEVVVVREDEAGLHFVSANGTRRPFERDTDPYSRASIRMPHEVLWTVPIPAATEEELKRLVRITVGMQGRHGSDRPWMLHVHARNDGIAYATPVLPVADTRELGHIHVGNDGNEPEYTIGNLAVWSRTVRIATDDEAFGVGSLVVMWPGKAHVQDGVAVHVSLCALDVVSGTIAELGDWMPPSMGYDSYYACPFKDVSEIAEEEYRARLRTEPNEALIFGYVDGDGHGATMLGSTGIVFHYSDDKITDVYGMGDPEPGLWLATNAHWAGSGEDVEMEVDLIPATRKDLARFGYDETQFVAEIAGNFDVPVDEVTDGLLDTAIAQASEIHVMDGWKATIHTAWNAAYTELYGASRNRGSYQTRNFLEKIVSKARQDLLAPDGLDVRVADDGSVGLHWGDDRLVAGGGGAITITLKDVERTYPDAASAERAGEVDHAVEWLRSRHEHANRSRPDDPRTILPLRERA